MKERQAMKHYTLILLAAALTACSSANTQAQTPNKAADVPAAPNILPSGADTAIVAGGCFWCVESDFEKLPGVYEVISGYTGGELPSPTYRNHGEHVEGAKIIFDPAVISYNEILDHYWTHVDPTDDGGQFCDRGHAYIPVIYARPDQRDIAEASKAQIGQTKPFSEPIRVPILEAKTFWNAEDYHQDYYKKNPIRYKIYRKGCGRDNRIQQLWGK